MKNAFSIPIENEDPYLKGWHYRRKALSSKIPIQSRTHCEAAFQAYCDLKPKTLWPVDQQVQSGIVAKQN
jgi:hypothetical protein